MPVVDEYFTFDFSVANETNIFYFSVWYFFEENPYGLMGDSFDSFSLNSLIPKKKFSILEVT